MDPGAYQGELRPRPQVNAGGSPGAANPGFSLGTMPLDTSSAGGGGINNNSGNAWVNTVSGAGTKVENGLKSADDWAHRQVGKLPVVGGISDMLTGGGSFAPMSTGLTDAAASDANAVRNGFVDQYAGLQRGAAPTMQGATLDTTQSDQSRGTQQSGLGTMGMGIGLQGVGAGVQGAGLATQGQGIDIQRGGLGALGLGLGAQQQGLGAQQQGLGAQRTGMGTVTDAANAYRNVLSGGAPSVANLEAQKLQGQTIGSMFGGAASARGVDRAGALRAAINGAGAVNTQGAANAAINTAREQEAAREGLLGAGGAQVGAGSAMTGSGSAMSGTGSAMGGIGQGISGIGQGITAGGQGISQTGAGLANTGAGLVNSGTAQTGAGTSIRNLDLTQASDQANLTQGAAANNLTSALTTNGQNITQQNNLGTLALGAQKNEQDAANAALEQQRKSQGQGQSNAKGALGAVGSILGSIF